MACAALFRTKRLETSKDDILSTELRRCLSTLDLFFIGIGTTLGSSVYIITGEVSQNIAGPAIIVSFVLAAIASILSGMCYAEFAARVPKAGSAYVYSYTVMGEVFAFVVGWNLILEYSIGGAAVVRGLSSYLDSVTGGWVKNTTLKYIGEVHIFGITDYVDMFSFLYVVLCTIFLSLGVKNSSMLNNLCTTVNVLVIVMIITMGSFYADFDNLNNFTPYGLSGVISGGSSCFFAFIGFDAICTISEEAKNPSRSVPISIVFTIGFCFLAYFGVALVLNTMVPYYHLDGAAALSKAFEQVGNKPAKYIIGVGALFGLTGCSIVSLMLMPRFLYSMAQDGLLFRFFGTVNAWSSVPVYATLVSGFLTGDASDQEDCVSVKSSNTYVSASSVPFSSRPVSPYITCRTAPSPRGSTERTVTICVALIVAEMFAFCGLLTFYQAEIFKCELQFLIPFVLIGLAILITTTVIARMPQKSQRLYYKVPFLPWLPVLSLFFNIYLMYGLKQLTWIRFGVWMVIGFLIYFGYGIWHSNERWVPTGLTEPD